jgi:hypothetical protein
LELNDNISTPDRPNKTVTIKVPDDLSDWKIRVYFSRSHLLSAAFFTRQSFSIEDKRSEFLSPGIPRAPEHLIDENRAYVIGSIFSSVSFLESLINEFFADAGDDESQNRLSGLDVESIKVLAETWKIIEFKQSIPEKYQLALLLNGKEIFDSGPSNMKDVSLLINLRNALIHFKPEWLTEKEDWKEIPTKWENKFGSNKITLCKLVSGKAPYFPDRLLGHGCAQWAILTSIKFADDFYERMGLIPSYNEIRQRLNTI